MVYTPLELDRLVTFKVPIPVLEMVRGSTAELPGGTVPKSSNGVETLIFGSGWGKPVPDNET